MRDACLCKARTRRGSSSSSGPQATDYRFVLTFERCGRSALYGRFSVKVPAQTFSENETPRGQADSGRVKREAWLLRQSHDQFMIQVSSSDDLAFLQRFAKLLSADTPSVIYHYKYNSNDQPEYGLASGLFDSRAIADRAVGDLPEEVQRYGPWVRRIGDIQRTVPGN